MSLKFVRFMQEERVSTQMKIKQGGCVVNGMMRYVGWCVSFCTLCIFVSFLGACKSTSGEVENQEPLTELTQKPEVVRQVEPEKLEPAFVDSPQIVASTHPVIPMSNQGEMVPVAEFGQGQMGYLLWSASSGKAAVMMIFEDTNGDQKITLKFGHHGESYGDRARPYLVDLETGQMTAYDEVWVWDHTSRYIALQKDVSRAVLDVWDTEEMRKIEVDFDEQVIEPTPDENRCMAPRQVALGEGGVLWGIKRGEKRVVKLDLKDGKARQEFDVRGLGEGRLWRIGSVGGDWLSVGYVIEDTDKNGEVSLPVQKTSCACRFCNRFAKSMGYYGWGGDAWAFSLMSKTGESSVGQESYVVPVSDAVALDVGNEELLSVPAMKPLKGVIPDGCSLASWLDGVSPSLVMMCSDDEGDGRLLLWDRAHGVRELPGLVADAPEQRVIVSQEGGHWFVGVVRVEAEEARYRIARVRLEDGYVQTFGEAYDVRPELFMIDKVRGVVAVSGGGIFDVFSGKLWRDESADGATFYSYDKGVKQIAFSRAEGVYSFVPEGSVEELGGEVRQSFFGGCVLSASGRSDASSRVDVGPWSVHCLRKGAAKKEER